MESVDEKKAGPGIAADDVGRRGPFDPGPGGLGRRLDPVEASQGPAPVFVLAGGAVCFFKGEGDAREPHIEARPLDGAHFGDEEAGAGPGCVEIGRLPGRMESLAEEEHDPGNAAVEVERHGLIQGMDDWTDRQDRGGAGLDPWPPRAASR
jgi:hypothetical protein